jgi:CBS domain-containing protein
MVMLSELRWFMLVDARQRQGRLADVAVALLEGDYPPVTHVCLRHAGAAPLTLRWEAVQSIDWPGRRIHVRDFEAAQMPAPEWRQGAVLLQQDILDALIIDLQHRNVTRANDLWLEEADGQWRLQAADTSVRALVRRLSHGRYGRVMDSALLDWKYVEFLRGDPHAVQAGAAYHRRITRLPAGEIARLTDLLPYLHTAELLTLLPDPLAADTLEALAPERQLQVFEELEEAQGLRLLALMAPDIAADLVGCLTLEIARHSLQRLPRQHSERIVELLQYPEDTVGGIMTNDVITAPAHLTIAEARRALYDQLKAPDFVYFIYVVEADAPHRLCGVVTLRDLLVVEEERVLRDVMRPYLVTLTPLEPASVAAYRLLTSGLSALPVVGHAGQLLGVVTIDAAVAQVAPASWRAQAPRVFA